MTAATGQLPEVVESYDPRELPPLSPELICALDLPANLPAEMTIAQVAEVIGVSAHTLRYYERIGLVEVGRDSAGHRVYDQDALARVVFVTRLRMSDMPIHVIRRYVDLVKLGDATAPDRLALMQAHRATILRRLQNLQAALTVIEHKVTAYGGDLAP